jgi:hypothetical protein
MVAQHNFGPTGVSGFSSPAAWDQTALLSALSSAGINNQTPPSSSDWYMDTGASSHMSNIPGNFPNSKPIPFSTTITVGNGARFPVTHSAATRDENGSDTNGYCGYRYRQFFFLGLNSRIEYGYKQYIFYRIVILIIFGS